jgi:hypothetical protein
LLAEQWKRRCGHEFLGVLAIGPIVMTPIIWVLPVVIVVLAIGGKLIFSRRARAAALRAQRANARPVDPECRNSGHIYKEFDTGWRCARCGNHVPRRDGELYGLVTDGKHERRREPR